MSQMMKENGHSLAWQVLRPSTFAKDVLPSRIQPVLYGLRREPQYHRQPVRSSFQCPTPASSVAANSLYTCGSPRYSTTPRAFTPATPRRPNDTPPARARHYTGLEKNELLFQAQGHPTSVGGGDNARGVFFGGM